MVLSNTPCKGPAYKSRRVVWRQGSIFILTPKKVKVDVPPPVSPSFSSPLLPSPSTVYLNLQPSTLEADPCFLASLAAMNRCKHLPWILAQEPGPSQGCTGGVSSIRAQQPALPTGPEVLALPCRPWYLRGCCTCMAFNPKPAILLYFSYPLIKSLLASITQSCFAFSQ